MIKVTDSDFRKEQLRIALDDVSKRNNGFLSTESVVEAARDPASVLHNEFEWDDSAAAEKYRLAQAGALIRTVTITIIKQAADPKQCSLKVTRAMQSLKSARGKDKPDHGYERITDIVATPHKREELAKQAIAELLSCYDKYCNILELLPVWNAIDDVREQYVHMGIVPSGHSTAGLAKGKGAPSVAVPC